MKNGMAGKLHGKFGKKIMKKILVTGSNGYVGSVMVPELIKAGFDVVGLDTCYYGECTLTEAPKAPREIQCDIRDVKPDHLKGVDVVIHLAALSNDAVGTLREEWTMQINYEATVKLAELARAAGVKRFLFSSSCIMYGVSDTAALVDETSALNPQTPYAKSKVLSEVELSRMTNDRFSPVFLRNGTMYGLSPRMRFDTVLNNLTGMAFTSGKIKLFSDGTPWRPVLHVRDVVKAFMHALQAPTEAIHNQAFNVGRDESNHQVRDLAERVSKVVPSCEIECLAQKDADQRTYKTSFNKFATAFPDFKWNWDVEKGIVELYNSFKTVGLTRDDFIGNRFTRLARIKTLLDQKALGDDLRWAN
jgi:nucleoside-diphosphate-sugar epimerase